MPLWSYSRMLRMHASSLWDLHWKKSALHVCAKWDRAAVGLYAVGSLLIHNGNFYHWFIVAHAVS